MDYYVGPSGILKEISLEPNVGFTSSQVFLNKLTNVDPGGPFLGKVSLKSTLQGPFKGPFGGP